MISFGTHFLDSLAMIFANWWTPEKYPSLAHAFISLILMARAAGEAIAEEREMRGLASMARKSATRDLAPQREPQLQVSNSLDSHRITLREARGVGLNSAGLGGDWTVPSAQFY